MCFLAGRGGSRLMLIPDFRIPTIRTYGLSSGFRCLEIKENSLSFIHFIGILKIMWRGHTNANAPLSNFNNLTYGFL